MTENKQKTAAESAMEQMMSAFTEFQRAGTGVMAWTRPEFLESVTEMNTELAKFISTRIREDLQTQEEILRCRDPLQLREIQCRYMQNAFEQYCEEMGRLVRLNQAALGEWSGRSAGD